MKINNETKVGILVVVAIILLILGYNLLKGNSLFSSDTTLYAVYDKVEGLSPSDPITVNGLKVGDVGNLQLTNQGEGNILVELTIKSDIDIPSNSVAEIENADLLGSKKVVLLFGNANTFLQDKDTISSSVGTGITDKLASKIDPITDEINHTLVSLDSVLSAFHSVLNVNTQKNLRSSIKSLSETMQNFSNTSAQLTSIASGLDGFINNINDQNEHINQVIGNTEKLTSALSKTDFQGTFNDLDLAINNLNGALEKINKGEGSLGALMNDDKLYKNLESASYNLNLLMEDLRLNPKRYVHFSIFGGKSKTKPLPSDTSSK